MNIEIMKNPDQKNSALYTQAKEIAYRVGFMKSVEEINGYTGAIYDALLWDRKIKLHRIRQQEKELISSYNRKHNG